MRRVLVTGATGFVGRALTMRLLSACWTVHGTILCSENPSELVPGVVPVVIEPLDSDSDLSHALIHVDTVIHLAARVHIMDDLSKDPLADYRVTNVSGTERLAWDAAKAGVKRLVFVSSIKVHGEETSLAYAENSPARATDPYGISKWEAEQKLRQIEEQTGMEIVIVRPTLVYGPGVKANFLKMMRIIKNGIPLPLASVNNVRSMTYVENLVDALFLCVVHPSAAGQTYVVSDGEDISTPELLTRLASSMQKQARLFSFPVGMLRLGAKVAGKSAVIERLVGSLFVNSSKIRRDLGWTPPFTMAEGLKKTAQWFLSLEKNDVKSS